MIKISEDRVLCGQKNGYLNVVDLNTFQSVIEYQLENSGEEVNDITNTSEEGVFAVAAMEGLFIIKIDET